MRRFVAVIAPALLALVALLAPAAPAAAADPIRGVVLEGSVDPASAQFVTRRLENAERDGAQMFLIEMDTPGGLASAMHDIVRAIESSPVPVVVWVGPPGSRAGSAGAYIAASSDLLAMAPGTNIGSATPVSAGGGEDLDRKVVNDAAAGIAALATAHGRNADAYRSMVTEGANFTAQEAVAEGVAERIAASREELLGALDGQTVGGRTLATEGADVRIDTMPWYLRLLQVLIDPNLLAILFGLGIAAIAFEVFHPGAVVPGVAGAVMLLLAVLGFAIVPFNWAGLAFIALAFVLFALEATVAGFGVLGLGGIACLVIGGLIVFDDAQGPVVSRPGLIIGSIVLGIAFVLVARTAWRAHRAPQTTGVHGMVGHVGVVRTAVTPDDGRVAVAGELWSARSAGTATINRDERVRVVDMHDLTLVVQPEPEEHQ